MGIWAASRLACGSEGLGAGRPWRVDRVGKGRAQGHRGDLPSFPGRERSAVDEMAREGMRVLGVAMASVPVDTARPDTARGFPFEYLGLVGIADPLRPAVPEAV